ncbi:bifunctional 2-keto-4-hydroxyglutarate aldolase/2-keto-3-deoxy-6-phosphogluconate aldolase [uncultured Anaerococcus sp.]|uniref:bifunctional 2-keto-4-hydroxyglutarate aldolase/2-keto-3-deoxy-6-phosphogluconate aldolase n=1 Tax=uncultured Anaerococcus sp. TaxID=293428 RepID=UPI0025D3AF5B|nr:bifunctional 2-keto-4-hydroxyglutarate aldolase/2-keto-3-deoxy-6-phosphogluconate aldolase [uncultured Anaerococcus sp.]
MAKIDTINRIKQLGIVPVIRASNKEEAIDYCLGLIDGGINVLEITFTIPDAINVFKEIKSNTPEDTLIGAGTVLDETTARLAILEGAKFIVSPSFDKNVAQLCNKYQVPYIPGCITPTEMMTAIEYGVDVIKLFPGSMVGPSYIKAIHGPMPFVNIMPTGGVNYDNLQDWFDAGAFAVGAGSNLVNGSREEIASRSKRYLERIEQIRES